MVAIRVSVLIQTYVFENTKQYISMLKNGSLTCPQVHVMFLSE